MSESTKAFLGSAAVAAVFGFAGATAFSYTGLAEQRTHAYLMENPDILRDMAEELQNREASERVSALGSDLAAPFPGAVLGNPQGSRTIVEFTDYGCTFCRQSVAHVRSMIAADPDLKVVVREWPIFEGSADAAGMALAAAQQGKFEQFHYAMFDAGPPSPTTIAAAAQAAGLDMAQASAFAASDTATFEMANNRSMAQALGVNGTPAWVIGDQVLEGMVGVDALSEALDEAG